MTKVCSKCKEAKEITEFGNRSRSKDGLQHICKSCMNVANRRRYSQGGAEGPKAKAAARYAENTDQHKERTRAWKENNPEKVLQQKARYRTNNKDKVAASKKAWAQANKGKSAAYSMKRYAAKKQRSVLWADDYLIARIYEEAQRLTELTGVQHHVDHIIPLQGKLVSGLHHQDNLQVLTAFENLSKNNNYDIQ